MGGASEEFPLLAAYGLEAVDILGDGNCLFNALSDQIYGHQNEHEKIRARVIEYMREHADHYKQYLVVLPGGGQRRNPKRKNAGVYSTPADLKPPTPEEIDRVFENHLSTMARGGTYGDNMEIVAFAAAFNTDVKIYQRDFAFMVRAPEDGSSRPIAHIAYHTWEHYSSIRNIGGPYTGLPNVRLKALSAEEEARNQAAAGTIIIHPWMINVVLKSLTYPASEVSVRKVLEECRGNVDYAVSKLLDAEDKSSSSSQHGSSSTERDPDSDDDFVGPNAKKQDRRMSRATKSHQMNATERDKMQAEQREKMRVSNLLNPAPILPPPALDLPVRILPKPSLQSTVSRLKQEEEEGWRTQSSDDDGDFHLDVDDVDDDAASTCSGVDQSQSSNPPAVQITNGGKSFRTIAKPIGPQRKRITARERIEMKKQAQKLARKAAKKSAIQGGSLGIASVNIQKNSPPLELGIGIKTLYI